MANVAGSPISVKVEENSQSVVFTYFQGDIGSMVDEHFSRALGKADRAKPQPDPVRSKKRRKSNKSEESNSCQWMATSSCSYPEAQLLSAKAHGSLPLSPMDESPSSWPPFPARGLGLGLTSMPYSITTDGLSLTGQQYATSLLNLLHSDHNEMGPGGASGSQPELLLPSWSTPAAFNDSLDPSVGFDPGRRHIFNCMRPVEALRVQNYVFSTPHPPHPRKQCLLV
ncbi:Transcription cofactor vestigial-like protein 3 [Merluccius polli]|uniref:Transcription cofactor vestigial-like protein 3 n=1 Tax=Merluccius polli TaxID=89951 RepID=A0AA47P381_MERPO|nr:Transcription cofactor vestigial-like protein 3 [Merluccius polli]